ncbi:hypothetical protein HOY34_11060 [Xinfangfangia sp. D13-10-4-6]|uniref:hypothetical protein n=1 Tax=Pseudogemmobacter hezensis TaxID=2737662 RepID=UPI001556DBB8|nr:hypothetical protein [Pseudogemmobacter hezensis]NPD15741.1 hypothetical protein [Pseudogemmobacter hezensis]
MWRDILLIVIAIHLVRRWYFQRHIYEAIWGVPRYVWHGGDDGFRHAVRKGTKPGTGLVPTLKQRFYGQSSATDIVEN